MGIWAVKQNEEVEVAERRREPGGGFGHPEPRIWNGPQAKLHLLL
jgi:hypothetical protein